MYLAERASSATLIYRTKAVLKEIAAVYFINKMTISNRSAIVIKINITRPKKIVYISNYAEIIYLPNGMKSFEQLELSLPKPIQWQSGSLILLMCLKILIL
jgi:hypothetical protein